MRCYASAYAWLRIHFPECWCAQRRHVSVYGIAHPHAYCCGLSCGVGVTAVRRLQLLLGGLPLKFEFACMTAVNPCGRVCGDH